MDTIKGVAPPNTIADAPNKDIAALVPEWEAEAEVEVDVEVWVMADVVECVTGVAGPVVVSTELLMMTTEPEVER